MPSGGVHARRLGDPDAVVLTVASLECRTSGSERRRTGVLNGLLTDLTPHVRHPNQEIARDDPEQRHRQPRRQYVLNVSVSVAAGTADGTMLRVWLLAPCISITRSRLPPVRA